MPSFHHFDTCWGNRRYFHDVYCELSSYDWLQDPEACLNASSNPSGFSSSNGYYGYQPVTEVRPPCEPSPSMEVETQDDRPPIAENKELQNRKRPCPAVSDLLDVKRVKTGRGNC